MKKMVICLFLFFAIFFTCSCQPKTEVQELTAKKLISREWRAPSYPPKKPEFRKRKSIVSSDPYREIWLSNMGFLSRFYLDINGDKIPELFLGWNESSDGTSYVVYKFVKSNYLYLGYVMFDSIQLLENKHFGNQDLMVYIRTGILENGRQRGILQVYEFDGMSYQVAREMEIELEAAIEEHLFTPNRSIRNVKHPKGELLWSPKEDEAYFNLVK